VLSESRLVRVATRRSLGQLTANTELTRNSDKCEERAIHIKRSPCFLQSSTGIGFNEDLDLGSFFQLSFVTLFIGHLVINANFSLQVVSALNVNLSFFRLARVKRLDDLLNGPVQLLPPLLIVTSAAGNGKALSRALGKAEPFCRIAMPSTCGDFMPNRSVAVR
jgi:hypothetical protein